MDNENGELGFPYDRELCLRILVRIAEFIDTKSEKLNLKED